MKLSTLGAVIPEQEVAGAKVYTTIAGQFSFVILLFSTVDGRPLASFDAGAITRLRTAACTVLAAAAGPARSATLALFGAGTQGVQHAAQLSAALPLRRSSGGGSLCRCGPADRLAAQCGIPVTFADPAVAAAQCRHHCHRLALDARRCSQGELIQPGTFIAAIGSSLPHTRELDDTALARAATVVVEWRPQSLREAGDLVLADEAVLPPTARLRNWPMSCWAGAVRRHADDIVIYKSVGVGLEDIALAGMAYRRITEAEVGASLRRAAPGRSSVAQIRLQKVRSTPYF